MLVQFLLMKKRLKNFVHDFFARQALHYAIHYMSHKWISNGAYTFRGRKIFDSSTSTDHWEVPFLIT